VPNRPFSSIDAGEGTEYHLLHMQWGEKTASGFVRKTAFLLLVLSVFGFSTQSRLQFPSVFSNPSSGHGVEQSKVAATNSQRLKAEEPLGEVWLPCVVQLIEPETRTRPPRTRSYDAIGHPGDVFVPTASIRPPPVG
jgi:hypothetical protein